MIISLKKFLISLSPVIVSKKRPIKLVLEDGREFQGFSFGADKEVQGEVVFNTGMTGYVETLTDPSYRGQILVTTFPLQGNYGVPDGPFEAPRIQVQGLIVSHYSDHPHHHASVKSLGKWLESQGIPAIYGIDTRTLTRHLRERGTINGAIEYTDVSRIGKPKYAKPIDMRKVLSKVAPSEVKTYEGGDTKILLIDTGAKENIVRSLLKREATVIRTPWNGDWEKLVDGADGVFLTNGPGDPLDAGGLIEKVRDLLSKEIPIFGICFGHQMLALAAGGKTFKMKYGHRSVNQPVQDLITGKCFVTSQNHGYVVQTESLSREWKPWFMNLNDKTNEGIRHVDKPFASVQFHPEASPGPQDTAYLFDEFMKVVRTWKVAKQNQAEFNWNILKNTPTIETGAKL